VAFVMFNRLRGDVPYIRSEGVQLLESRRSHLSLGVVLLMRASASSYNCE
jgi:hypothetical protein